MQYLTLDVDRSMYCNFSKVYCAFVVEFVSSRVRTSKPIAKQSESLLSEAGQIERMCTASTSCSVQQSMTTPLTLSDSAFENSAIIGRILAFFVL